MGSINETKSSRELCPAKLTRHGAGSGRIVESSKTEPIVPDVPHYGPAPVARRVGDVHFREKGRAVLPAEGCRVGWNDISNP